MIRAIKFLSIIGLFFILAPFAHAATTLSCVDDGNGTTCHASPGLPGNMMATAYAGTYPDVSNNLAWSGTWSPWARCSGSGCSFGSFNLTSNSNDWCNHDCGSLGTFWIRFAGNGAYPLDTSSAPGDGEYIFQYNGSNPELLVSSTTGSRITSTTPGNGDTIATSTTFTFGVTGYIAPDDFVSGMKVKLSYSNGGFESSLLVGPAFATIQQHDSSGSYSWDVSSSGSFTFSTTTSVLVIGNYDLEAHITQPKYTLFGFNFFEKDLDYQHNYFVVSTSTAYGTLRNNVQNEFDNFSGLSSSTINTSVCNPISGNFSVIPCVSILFIPSPTELTHSMNVLHDTVLAKWPWGYVTRLVAIMTDSSMASSSLPAYVTKVDLRGGGDVSGDMENITIDPQDMLVGGASLVDSIQDTHGYGVTFRDVAEPIAKLVIALFVLSIIWHDLLGIVNHRRRPDNT